MSDYPTETQALGEQAARQLANATKTVPQLSTITPRWLLKLLSWVPVEAGIYRVNRVVNPELVAVLDAQVDDEPLPRTFVDYETHPRELTLRPVATIVDVQTRVSDLYSSPHNQVAQQLRLTVETIKEHQEFELINNADYGLLSQVVPQQRSGTLTGPPTPDDLDGLLAKVWKTPSFFLTHPAGRTWSASKAPACRSASPASTARPSRPTSSRCTLRWPCSPTTRWPCWTTSPWTASMSTSERTWGDVDALWPPTAPLTPAISPESLAALAAQAFGTPAPVGTIVPQVPGLPAVPDGLSQAGQVAPRGGGATTGIGSTLAPAHVHDGFDPAQVPDVRPTNDTAYDTAYDTSVFDVATLRRDFPILAEQVHGRPLIWLDNAATTQKPRAVIDRLTWFYERENSNIHRTAHELAARATEAYEDARATVRRFLNAPREQEIAFVRGTTEGINLVAHAWGTRNLREGDEIVITQLEHHANIVPWQMVARRTGAMLKVAPVDDAGTLLMDRFAELLGPRTRLVSVTAVSNALGTVTPLDQIVAPAHRVGARVLVDGAQSVPHLPVDLQRVPADFFTFSGHKIFGPTGIGALYVSERVWDETPAWHGGGNMIEDVTFERSVYKSPPDLWEAGTGNIADAVGLGETLKYVERIGIERIAAWEHRLLDHATPRLAAVPGVRLVGTAREKASVLSFVMDGHDPLEVGKRLDAEGIAVRAGHHCAQPILRRLGLEATVRPAFAFHNTLEEADAPVAAVARISESSVRPV